MNPVQKINRFFLLATAPFLGMLICLFCLHFSVSLPSISSGLSEPDSPLAGLSPDGKLDQARTAAAAARTVIGQYYESYANTKAQLAAISQSAADQAGIPAAIYDRRVTAKLGEPIRETSTANIDLKLYSFVEPTYKAYALKVNLKSDKAMTMVLGQDKIGGSETTLEAAGRYGAAAGINAGGFEQDSGTGRLRAAGTTVVRGKYLQGFMPGLDSQAFVGLGANRKLIGGRFGKQEDLDKLQPVFGAMFAPVLLQNGRKMTIPGKWLTSPARAPRTVVGSYRHDQLLFIVTDGYDERGNSGAALPELQDKLLSLGIRDGYNLDGSGSSSLIYDGQVINAPPDGKLHPVAANFLFFK